MTTWQQPPADQVQVPQTVGLSPEIAFNLVGQSGLAPMFQAQPFPGMPTPGVATQWGQAPASFGGLAPTPETSAQIVGQNPVAGSWVPRGSVVYLEWAQTLPLEEGERSSPLPWIIAGVLAALLLLGLLFLFLANDDDKKDKPDKSPSPTPTLTQTTQPTQQPTSQPTQTVTQTATATKTTETTKTAESTVTATTTVTASP